MIGIATTHESALEEPHEPIFVLTTHACKAQPGMKIGDYN